LRLFAIAWWSPIYVLKTRAYVIDDILHREMREEKNSCGLCHLSLLYDIRHILNDIRHAYIGFYTLQIDSHGAPFMMPCEIAVKSLIPAMRAYVAKELTQTHRMKQDEVANLLGISQTAISKYISNVRGQAFIIAQTGKIPKMLSDIAAEMSTEKISGSKLTQRFCEVCKTARHNGLMCTLCRRYDSTLNIETCRVCRVKDTTSVC